MTAEQFTFDLPLEQRFDRDSLLVGQANKAAVLLLDSWPQWPSPYALLAGPTGSGKSHIAHAWKARAQALALPVNGLDIDLAQPATHVLIDDIAPGLFDETHLFHVMNWVRQNGKTLLMTSTSWPGSWQVQTPDLLSRLRAATTIEIHEPDDLLLRSIFIKLFTDRQLLVDAGVADYLVLRVERSLRSAIVIVDALDRLSLARQSRITKRLAGEVLEAFEQRDAL
ncbi:MAG: DnaA/Hda family protein [Ahrensia sp.]